MYDADAVTALVRSQAGVVSRAQLAALQVSPEDIKRLVRQRLLFRLGSGFYVNQHGPLTPIQRVWWACLRYAPAAAADETALQLARDATGKHLELPIHIALASGRNPAVLPGVLLHRVARLDALVGWNGRPPRMQPAHAAVRVASRAADDNEVVGRLAEAVNWRLVSAARLLDALRDLPSLPRRAFIHEVLVDVKDGACSVLERAYLVRVERAHGLPVGRRQAPRRTPDGQEFRDVEYEDFALVVELQGRAFHSGKQAWDADLERALDDMVGEKASVGLGWRQVLGTPCRTAGKVARLLQQRGWSAGPLRCGPDCRLGS